MPEPIILSDEDETPFPAHSKKRRTDSDLNPTVLVIDDDPTPQKPPPPSSSTPSFVPETPFSVPSTSDVSFVKCNNRVSLDSDPLPRASISYPDIAGISKVICLESDSELENYGMDKGNEIKTRNPCLDFSGDSRWTTEFSGSGSSPEKHASSANATNETSRADTNPAASLMDGNLVHDHSSKENISVNMEQEEKIENDIRSKTSENNAIKTIGKTKISKEERARLMEEKKLMKEQEKFRKAALKAEAAELKKNEKEKQQWQKGKFAKKSIVAEIDTKVVESGSIGGHLLTMFAEKGLTYRITSNPIERSILWSMKVPEHITQPLNESIKIPYVLLVHEAEKFCDLINNESLLDNISTVRNFYPTYTVCYLTNRLMAYINKREQAKYKNQEQSSGWKRPPVEEALAMLTTHFTKVNSRQCVDEAELADHVVGLTCSLASCQFRKKLSRLSVNANGSLVPKDSLDRNLIKKNVWLKALVAIPKVQPRFAIAIWKKYPTMKSLLTVYMDPNKSEHEKEFLLKDLKIEGLVGDDRRLGEVCSKRVYRILMAQSGGIRTDDVEDGADFFERQ